MAGVSNPVVSVGVGGGEKKKAEKEGGREEEGRLKGEGRGGRSSLHL